MANPDRVLSVHGLRVWLHDTALVDGIDLTLARGERVGIVGESGSGKSLTSLSIMGLLPEGLQATGSIELAGHPGDLLTANERELSRLRGSRLGMVFQEPMSALNPVMRVGAQVAETLRLHNTVPGGGTGRGAARHAAVELLEQVRLPDPAHVARAYPHELSGGQRQRVLIAIALANNPAVLVCDEPTSALDVTVQAQILDLITTITAEREVGLAFITHDLAVVASVCDRVLVLSEGRVVETGPVDRVFGRPAHTYTAELIAASALPARAAGDPAASDPAAGGRPASGTQSAAAAAGPHPVLAARDLHRRFRRPRTSLRAPAPDVQAVRGVSFDVAPGERFGIVGESGSGKSTLIRLLAGLDRPTAGSVRFDGHELAGRSERDLRPLRMDLQLVFQDPAGSLDPRMRVRDIVAEPLLARRVDGVSIPDRVREVLTAVGLPEDAGSRFPHEFSGGQRQRISIARALAPRPRVILADEPVSALDAPIRKQVLDLLAQVTQEYDLTLVFVSHDLTVVRHVCDRVAVLLNGELVELGTTDNVYDRPTHPYTRQLLAAVPTLPARTVHE